MEFDLKRVLIVVGAALLILLAAYQTFMRQDLDNSKDQEESNILFEPVLSDTSEAVLYYEGDRNYYLYGLDEVMVTYQEETKSLKDFLVDGVDVEDFVSQMNRYAVYDGGSNLYRDEDQNEVSILVCHRSTSSGGYNEDVYIGNYLMGYEEGFCE